MLLRILLPQFNSEGTGYEANWANVIISDPDSEVPKAMSIAEKAGALLVELLNDQGEVIRQLATDRVLHPKVLS